MYSRPSKYRNINIPENYSGNAFGNTEGEMDLPETGASTWEPAGDFSPEATPKEEKPKEKDSLFPSLLAGKFPFGHGLGTEELIIIGVMLIILRSPDEKPDSDMLLILGLLLFAG